MTGPVALKAAYIVTWVVLLGYLGSLWRRFRRVREEMRDLRREGYRVAKFVFDKIVTGDEIKGIIQKDLGSDFRVEVKENRIQVVQDALRVVQFSCENKDGKTVCQGPYGDVSIGLRLAIFLGAAVLLSLIGASMGYLVIVPGALPMIILALLRKAPSRALVARVAGILGKATGKGMKIPAEQRG